MVACSLMIEGDRQYCEFTLNKITKIVHKYNGIFGGSENGKHRTYTTDTLDLISVTNNITNFNDEVKTLPQTVSRKQWFGSHSIENYVLAPAQKAMKTAIVKTQQGNKKYYTSPQMEFKQNIIEPPRDYCSDNPNSQKCKKINKAL